MLSNPSSEIEQVSN